MEASLVSGMTPEHWTVAHDDGGVSRGSLGRVAFTSRKAIAAVGGGLLVEDHAWDWEMPANSPEAQMLSLVPNRHVLVLDEAWGWKFPGECPPLNSTEDGRAVLEKLLQGRVTAAQGAFSAMGSRVANFVQFASPEERLCLLVHLQNRWELYRQADKWSPNNRSDHEGNLVFRPLSEWSWVLTSLEETPITWPRDSSYPGELPPNTELMVLENSAANLDHAWKPEPVTRTAPAYLSLT